MTDPKSARAGWRATTALAALILGAGLHGAAAQNTNSGVSIGPSEELAAPTQPPPAPAEHLLGDWGGVRTYLGNLGIDLSLDYTGEFAGNVSGGVKQGSTLAGQVGFEADIDWGKLAGLTGLSTHAVIVNRHGSSDSGLFGDNLLPVQEIYGSGGNTVVHLVYAYAEQELAGGRVNLAIGRMPVLNDFDASPLNCNFMNNSLCGNPKTLPGADVGISSYPDAVWGARFRVRPTPQGYVMAGVYEVNQGIYSYRNFRTGFKFDGSQDSGIEVPVEIAYEPTLGPDRMPGHYKAGFAYDSTSDVKFPTSPSGLFATTQSHGNKGTFWLAADQMIIRNGPGPMDGVILIADYAHSDPALSVYTEQFTVAALDHNFWSLRPQDTIGVLFTYQRVSGALGKEQALDQFFGLPYANGATGIQTHEEILEVNYDIHVMRGVNFQPEFQYVFRPNAQSNIKDAAVFGFKTHINF